MWVATCPAANAQEAGPPEASATESLVITGAKSSPADRELTRQVEAALESDRYLDASRVTVTTKDGVVTLEGVVSDAWDLLRVIRISNRIAGAKRVERNLDMPDFDCGP